MKKHIKSIYGVFIIVIFITLLVCSGLYAAEEILPTPEEIIAKNIEAMGGIKALKKIKNKKIVQIRKFDQMKLEIKDTIYQERPNNYYVVMDTGVREGADGKMAWFLNPYSGTKLLEGDELSLYLSDTKFDDLDVSYISMKTEGIEQINGKDCYKVVKISEKGRESIDYYDKKSFMIVKTLRIMLRNTKFETYIEEYQKIDNLIFPHKEVIFMNGQKYEEKTIEEIELNIEMPEGIFDIPEEVKAIMNKK